MRIVGGTYRGKQLIAPAGDVTRPTSDRARESVFNIIDSRLMKAGRQWSDLSVFDAFAGTGALGIEAVSRGAGVLFAAERDKTAQQCWYKNTQGLKNVSLALYSDMLSLPKARQSVGLVLMDPPYKRGLTVPALTELERKGWLDPETLCVVEVEKSEKDVLSDGFETLDERVYGKAKIILAVLKNK